MATCVGDARLQQIARRAYQADAVAATTEGALAADGALQLAVFSARALGRGGFEPVEMDGASDIITLMHVNSILIHYAPPLHDLVTRSCFMPALRHELAALTEGVRMHACRKRHWCRAYRCWDAPTRAPASHAASAAAGQLPAGLRGDAANTLAISSEHERNLVRKSKAQIASALSDTVSTLLSAMPASTRALAGDRMQLPLYRALVMLDSAAVIGGAPLLHVLARLLSLVREVYESLALLPPAPEAVFGSVKVGDIVLAAKFFDEPLLSVRQRALRCAALHRACSLCCGRRSAERSRPR